MTMKAKVATVVGMLLIAGVAQAGSCAYESALLALERGNLPRATGLLAIAAREGNPQAVALLRRLKESDTSRLAAAGEATRPAR